MSLPITVSSVCAIIVFLWGIAFIGLQRWSFARKHNLPRRRQRFWRSVYHEADTDVAREHAQNYLLRVATLTNASELDGGYILTVDGTTFHVSDRFVRRLRTPKDLRRYETTCFFVPNQAMPKPEQTATAMLMLRDNPTLFDKWCTWNGVSFKADGSEVLARLM